MTAKFDKIVERRGTNSVKWDACKNTFARDDLLPMWVADSDWPAPGPVIEAVKKRVEHGIFGYTEPGEELDRVVVNWVKRRYNWEIKSEWLVYISGVVPAINVSLKTFTGPGGKVIVQPPVYAPFFAAVEKSGARLIENQLILIENKYKMDLNDLEEKLLVISKGGKTEKDTGSHNMLIFCSPHNPVGRVWSKEELEELGNLCLKYNIIIISDEIHGDLIYSGYRQIPIASISKEIAANTITMIAPSKTFNLAGFGAAVAIIPDKKMRDSFTKTMQGFVTNGNLIAYTAMKAAYSQSDQWLSDQMAYLEKNRDFAVEYINSFIPGIKVLKPEGTYLLWLDCRNLNLNNKVLETFMVEEAGVGLNSGKWFGNGGEGFMRLNMACPRAILEEGLERIRKAVKKL